MHDEIDGIAWGDTAVVSPVNSRKKEPAGSSERTRNHRSIEELGRCGRIHVKSRVFPSRWPGAAGHMLKRWNATMWARRQNHSIPIAKTASAGPADRVVSTRCANRVICDCTQLGFWRLGTTVGWVSNRRCR